MKLTKDIVQAQAIEAWIKNDYKGLVCGATGVGKSRIGVLAAELAYKQDKEATDVVIVAPFVELLKITWPEEFITWGLQDLWQYVTVVTYASLHKLEKKPRSLILLDEAHHLTKNCAEFFKDNTQTRILGLTATPPAVTKFTTDSSNVSIISSIIPTIYTVSLTTAVEHGLVADYRVFIVDCFMDAKDKYIKSGTKTSPYYTSEATAYLYCNKSIRKAAAMGNMGWAQALCNKRMHLIYNFKSKTTVAKQILDKLEPEKRVIVFCGSKDQAESMGIPVYHSGTKNDALIAFKSETINRLAVVKSLDEGHNLPNVDVLLIVQAESVARSTVQRLGRGIRFRVGHVAKVFILATQNTKDADWVKSATEELDETKIKHYSSLKLLAA